MNPEVNLGMRSTLNIKDLKSHILMNLNDFEGDFEENEIDDEEN